LTPDQSELLAQSQQSGILSLVLRALGDSEGEPIAKNATRRRPLIAGSNSDRSAVTVFRYGVLRGSSPAAASSGGTNSGGTVVASDGGGSASTSTVTNPVTVTTTNAPTVGVPQ
jgi:hypothetical protein